MCYTSDDISVIISKVYRNSEKATGCKPNDICSSYDRSKRSCPFKQDQSGCGSHVHSYSVVGGVSPGKKRLNAAPGWALTAYSADDTGGWK
jgi:hypothetical protein